MHQNKNHIVVAGIHTNIGKTVIAAILTEALSGYYWKPIQCGMPSDREWVSNMLSLKNRCYPESFSLTPPCSPHLAAKMSGVRIEAKNLTPPLCLAPLIIEGTGGLLSPLNDTESWIDAAVSWNALWVLVHSNYLGSLNHFLLTIESIKQKKLPLLGIVFNGETDTDTERMLLKRANAPCIGRLTWQKELTPAIIKTLAQQWQPTLLSLL